MALYDAYATDPKAEAEGVWIKFDGGFELLIARCGGANTEFAKTVAELTSGVEKDADVPEETVARIYARSIIKGVRGGGFVGPDGEPIEPGSDELVKALVDLPEFFNEVFAKATSRSTFARATNTAKR